MTIYLDWTKKITNRRNICRCLSTCTKCQFITFYFLFSFKIKFAIL